ncbi:MAG: hypothetical protein AAB877_01445 [Patescibacteria group bacterium]
MPLKNSKAEEKARRLSQNQARALKAMVSFPSNAGSVSTSFISNASGLRANELGGTVSALERNGFIQPIGRVGRTYNWELSDPDIIEAKKDDKKSLIEILNRVSNS